MPSVIAPPSLPRVVSHRISPRSITVGIFFWPTCEDLAAAAAAAAAVWVLGCWEARNDVELPLCVFVEWLRGNPDDVNVCPVAYIHPYFFFHLWLYRSLSSFVAW